MSIISLPFTFSAGAVIIAAQHNSNFNTIYSDYNGNIQNVNIAANAGIVYSKLTLTGGIVNGDLSSSLNLPDSKIATITTAGKIDGTAITDLPGIPSGAGVMPTVNLGSGTANTLTFLRGDQTYIAPTGIPSNIQVFTTTGTWTKPSGISKVYVKVIGAGGAGAVGGGTTSGAGGGGGGYAEGLISVTGNVTVTIGSTNSFAGTTTISATAGTDAATITPGTGGSGSNGTINLTGSSGQGGFSGSASNIGGCGGGTAMGPGGGGGKVAVAGGNGGSYGGGGGGGGATSGAGSIGDSGAVIVYY